ncbi:MAG: RluA family pseudouridine synthase [Deltaproteobacteria bacterium]|nr:RluA family pseudouridine synthase [Deltaproteobacteria bacterium]
MTGTHRLTVPKEKAGRRLDLFLAEALPALSRSRVRQLISEGRVVLPGGVAKPSTRLKGDEEIAVTVPAPRPPGPAAEDRPLEILFQDPHLLVVNKPAGMVVHPAPGHADRTLVNVLLARADRLSGIGGVERPGIVHRLDKDTSGILVVAKTDAAHARLSDQLSAHRMERRYHGIVWGRPPRESGTVETRVGRHPVHRWKMAVLPSGGRRAVTHYRLLSSFGGFSLVEFLLATGRTHQVRLHCAHIGCPIVGDDVYGKPRKIPLGKGPAPPAVAVSRFLLHAFRLGFVHPATGERLLFEAPDPPEFDAFRAAVSEGGAR